MTDDHDCDSNFTNQWQLLRCIPTVLRDGCVRNDFGGLSPSDNVKFLVKLWQELSSFAD